MVLGEIDRSKQIEPLRVKVQRNVCHGLSPGPLDNCLCFWLRDEVVDQKLLDEIANGQLFETTLPQATDGAGNVIPAMDVLAERAPVFSSRFINVKLTVSNAYRKLLLDKLNQYVERGFRFADSGAYRFDYHIYFDVHGVSPGRYESDPSDSRCGINIDCGTSVSARASQANAEVYDPSGVRIVRIRLGRRDTYEDATSAVAKQIASKLVARRKQQLRHRRDRIATQGASL